MDNQISLGLIGCDTPRCLAYASVLNDPDHEHHISGARIGAAFPGGSTRFDLSLSRVDSIARELEEKRGIAMLDSPEEVAEQSDGILLTSVDGGMHLEEFKRIVASGKPTFIDKPFALDFASAREIFQLADEHDVPIMSCSALRYADPLVELLNDTTEGHLFGADFYCPMPLQPTQPGLFWYGIHGVEMLFTALGKGCLEVRACSSDEHDLVTGLWRDGSVGSVRGNRRGNDRAGGVIHRDNGSHFVDVYAGHRPYYSGLLEQILAMVNTGTPPIDHEETIEIIRFIEAANQSRESGESVLLNG